MKSKFFDLVSMDIKISVMSGYDAARAIREINREEPIVKWTSGGMKRRAT